MQNNLSLGSCVSRVCLKNVLYCIEAFSNLGSLIFKCRHNGWGVPWCARCAGKDKAMETSAELKVIWP